MKTQGIKHSRSTNRLNFAGLNNPGVPVKFRIIVSSPDGRVYDRGVCYGTDVQSAKSWLPCDITRLGDIHLEREENQNLPKVGVVKQKRFGIMKEREREKEMRMIEMITSDCCGDEVRGYGFCACCLEHCIPILEYYPDPSDPESAPSKQGLT